MPVDPLDRPTSEGEDGPAGLRFPDLPRLELDQLLAQLVERAKEVMGTQGRLRALLRANQMFAGELNLPVLLEQVATAARDLIGCRYAAVGVVGPHGGLVEFVHVGMPAEVVAAIGAPPQGTGLLGAVIDDPRPLRLRHLADDPRCGGLPTGHPPMEDFLGMPVRVRGEVFAAVYLVESDRGEFSAEDEELLGALAMSAGVAIDNARLYESARARGEWLQGSAAITRQLLSVDPDAESHPLQLIAERMLEIADADLVVLLLPDDRPGGSGQLAVEVGVGAAAEAVRGQQFPLADSLAADVLRTGKPALTPQLADGTGLAALVAEEVAVGAVLAVPLLGSGRVHGVLVAARRSGRPAFTAADLDMAGSFANHAALAIELAQARVRQQQAVVLDDRERIAADLHDHVVQRLFAAGLTMQSVVAGLGEGRVAARLTATVQDLDDTIRQIRSTIFQLQREPRADEQGGVRSRLVAVVEEVGPALGFQPALRFSGLLEDTLPAVIVDDLLAVLREALTNVARHAGACSAEVDVTVAGGRLTLQVTDDGHGMGDATRRSGLANLRRRAENHGGAFEVSPAEPSGTNLCWSVSIS